MAIEADSARVFPPPSLVYLAALLLGLAVDINSDLPALGLNESLRIILGPLLFAAGITLMLWAAGLFRRARTDVKPWKPTTAIVNTGVYAFTRNPMYLGMALLYAGVAVRFNSLVALALLPLVLLWVRTQVIAKEERYLTAKFGDAYLAYSRRVRRWL
jgi:protein-S-isoprenylcysteine O-methyltransferase Ste14